MLVVIATIAILVSLLLPGLAAAKSKAQRTKRSRNSDNGNLIKTSEIAYAPSTKIVLRRSFRVEGTQRRVLAMQTVCHPKTRRVFEEV